MKATKKMSAKTLNVAQQDLVVGSCESTDDGAGLVRLPSENALEWRSEMPDAVLHYSGDVEMCVGEHPIHGKLAIIMGAAADYPAFILTPAIFAS